MKRLIAILAAAATLSLIFTVTPAAAHDRHPGWLDVTHGRFQPLPGGLELGIDMRGRAQMYRVGTARDGATLVVVRVRKLAPNTTYPVHVHNQPCSATPPGGGHYQNVVGGPVDPVNEMWPVIETNRRGRGVGFAVHDARAREDAQSIVVHYPDDTSIRLGCLDLR